jgi:3'5'-cyclic nucleotide phosphodiesterase
LHHISVQNNFSITHFIESRFCKIVVRGIPASEAADPLLVYKPPHGTCLDEIRETIKISEFTSKSDSSASDAEEGVEIDDDVLSELREYVCMIARMYRDNPFHNFDHACHVAMSVNKLLKRIVSPEIDEKDIKDESCYAALLHNHTYGLCSDPLARFAIAFSALIHDVDHRGCSNAQLIKEEESMGVMYREKSVAEQNSVDISWNLLMEDRFQLLRAAIFKNQDELLRFRQLVVNTVLATDIFDKELNDLRKKRWSKAFSEVENCKNISADQINRKATIVIEHIIQASDVSHTMQHWHVYRKWNKLLFKEMYLAYQSGRMGADPSQFWYEGELGFFDNYIIPLAMKLKECNVFGVSSDEYYNYASKFQTLLTVSSLDKNIYSFATIRLKMNLTPMIFSIFNTLYNFFSFFKFIFIHKTIQSGIVRNGLFVVKK